MMLTFIRFLHVKFRCRNAIVVIKMSSSNFQGTFRTCVGRYPENFTAALVETSELQKLEKSGWISGALMASLGC